MGLQAVSIHAWHQERSIWHQYNITDDILTCFRLRKTLHIQHLNIYSGIMQRQRVGVNIFTNNTIISARRDGKCQPQSCSCFASPFSVWLLVIRNKEYTFLSAPLPAIIAKNTTSGHAAISVSLPAHSGHKVSVASSIVYTPLFAPTVTNPDGSAES